MAGTQHSERHGHCRHLRRAPGRGPGLPADPAAALLERILQAAGGGAEEAARGDPPEGLVRGRGAGVAHGAHQRRALHAAGAAHQLRGAAQQGQGDRAGHPGPGAEVPGDEVDHLLLAPVAGLLRPRQGQPALLHDVRRSRVDHRRAAPQGRRAEPRPRLRLGGLRVDLPGEPQRPGPLHQLSAPLCVRGGRLRHGCAPDRAHRHRAALRLGDLQPQGVVPRRDSLQGLRQRRVQHVHCEGGLQAGDAQRPEVQGDVHLGFRG
mmetsp:Transcript_117516/g.312611  ORF Transcript_117516/g.312611 Transcript_117516/m.312611 type:complete len:263 (-) Transcript_117516:532-1320(-)